MARLSVPAVLLSLAALITFPALADGDNLSRWAGRVQLSSAYGRVDTPSAQGGSRLLSANLLGDYYLTKSGNAGFSGGLRATGGLLMGPLSLSQSSAGLALSSTSSFAIGQRSYALTGPGRALDANSSLSYLGIGYTAHVRSNGLAFSADFGWLNGNISGLRLGRSSAQGLDDVMSALRFKPLLLLGLAYSY